MRKKRVISSLRALGFSTLHHRLQGQQYLCHDIRHGCFPNIHRALGRWPGRSENLGCPFVSKCSARTYARWCFFMRYGRVRYGSHGDLLTAPIACTSVSDDIHNRWSVGRRIWAENSPARCVHDLRAALHKAAGIITEMTGPELARLLNGRLSLIVIDDGYLPADGHPQHPPRHAIPGASHRSTTRDTSLGSVPSQFERQTMLEKVTKQKLVVIGNGMAGMRTVEELLEARARPLRHHHLRRRAARQLQPHHAVAGAVRREDLRRHHPQRRAGTPTTASRCTRARPVVGSIGATRDVVTADGTQRALRPADDRHRLDTRSSCRCPARICPASSPSATSTTSSACSRRRTRQRNAVVIGGGLLGLEAANGLHEARHGRHRRASARHADGAPARSGRRRPAAQVAGRARHRCSRCRAQTEAILGEDRVERRALRRRHGDPGRPRGDGGRHPPEHRAGQGGRARSATAASSSTTPCRPPTRASTRSANASSIAARPTAWSRRSTSRPRSAPPISPAGLCPLRRLGDLDQAQGHRHRPVLRRRLRRRRGHGGDRAARRRARRLQAARPARTTASSAPCSTATPPTAPGTSTTCATAPTSRRCATR